MTQPFSDIETAILHVRRAKITVMEQRERIAFLIAKGHSVGLARDLLAALESNLELTRKHLHLAIDDLRGYRYHLTLNGEIEAVQPLARTNDAKAILDVALVMDSTSPEFGAEIWNGKKLVMRIPPRMR